jgi:hypothetical protein
VDSECRKAMRARLIERVNIIQHRLDEENDKLHKKQVCVHVCVRERERESVCVSAYDYTIICCPCGLLGLLLVG